MTAALSHQFLKTEESREDVRIGVSQMFGFFHHLKHISLEFLVQHPHSTERKRFHCLNICGNNLLCCLSPDKNICLASIYTSYHCSSSQQNHITARSHVIIIVTSQGLCLAWRARPFRSLDSQCIASAWQETGSAAVCRRAQSRTGRDCGGAERRPRSQRRTAALVQKAMR